LIPQAYIQAWREHAPWPNPAQVEKKMIICREVCDLLNAPALTRTRVVARSALTDFSYLPSRSPPFGWDVVIIGKYR
jgi:hypothetical protein